MKELCHKLIAAVIVVASFQCLDAAIMTTIAGPPEIMGGPLCCVFDSPFLALQTRGNVTLGYTANSQSYVWSQGPTVDSQLPKPLYTNLGPDPSNTSFSHCGKWLNAAFLDDSGVMHGYFHQEWHCDYAHELYTNKSIAYAFSKDGGLTFEEVPDSQIISGNNFSTAHATGEGDHGVVRLGEWLYLYFIEWDAPVSIHGGTSVGLARSAVSDAGRPGTWWKYYNGSWAEPGRGGRADAIANMPGTAAYWVPEAGMLLSVGVLFSGPLRASWSPDGLAWTPSPAGPIFAAGYSNWFRNASSSELFGYPSLSGPQGVGSGIPSVAYVYVTYLRPGTGFDQRWMVRRPLRLVASTTSTTPPALAALSLWCTSDTPLRAWATSGPVAPPDGYVLTVRELALLPTWAPPAPAPALVALVECQLHTAPMTVALARPGECGDGAMAGGHVLRPAGWVAATQADAVALGWGHTRAAGQPLGLGTGALWRCIAGAGNYSAAFGDASCTSAGAGFGPDVLLGYAISPSPTQ